MPLPGLLLKSVPLIVWQIVLRINGISLIATDVPCRSLGRLNTNYACAHILRQHVDMCGNSPDETVIIRFVIRVQIERVGVGFQMPCGAAVFIPACNREASMRLYAEIAAEAARNCLRVGIDRVPCITVKTLASDSCEL